MFKHYIFTRWNLLDSKTTIYNNHPDPEVWMKHRMKIFEEYTLPSVMIQTCKNFTWLLAFARETPKWIIEKYSSFPNVKIIYGYPAEWLRMEYNSEYAKMTGRQIRDGDWIITSRLDNDDTIAPEYIETVQSYFNEEFLIVDTDGVKKDLRTGKEYTVERRTNNSPFLSLIEQVGKPWMSISNDPKEKRLIEDPVKTCYWCSHTKMEWHFPSVKSPKKLYKMNLHEMNVSNKLEGNEILL